jgi:photosystem II stability/assembly factor-like uncharacterized protein
MAPASVSRGTRIGISALAAVVVASIAWAGAHHAALFPPAVWNLIYERPASGKYEDMAFTDSLRGWLIHSSGVILQTDDGGKSWTRQAIGFNRLRTIDFLDARRGFAGSLAAKLYGTTDGGATWKDVGSTLPRAVTGICGITHRGNTVHVVGRYYGLVADYFRSPDGGKTWVYQSLRDVAQALVDVAFVTDSVGFIGGMAPSTAENQGPAAILKTRDGGKTWRRVFTHDGGRGFAWKIFPITQKLIYAALQSQDGVYRVAKTTDGGEEWQVLTVAKDQPPGPGLQAIGFLDAKKGWVGGFFQGMWATRDGGKTWTRVDIPDGTINRFERVGSTLITAGTRGVLRLEKRRTPSVGDR